MTPKDITVPEIRTSISEVQESIDRINSEREILEAPREPERSREEEDKLLIGWFNLAKVQEMDPWELSLIIIISRQINTSW